MQHLPCFKNHSTSIIPVPVPVQYSVVSHSLQPHESQHARPPCPSPTPGVYPNPCPLSWWCHQPSHPLSSPSPPAPNPSSVRVFSNESTLHMRWPKYWSFSFNISPSSEHPGLISFRMDWLDLLAVQGTLKNLLQHHSSKPSILQRSAFFTIQLSHPYMTTGKTIALTRWTFVGKVMSLHLNMLSRLVKRVPEKHLFLLYWLCQSLWLCGSQQTVENSLRDGNTRPPDLLLEKPICRSGSNS